MESKLCRGALFLFVLGITGAASWVFLGSTALADPLPEAKYIMPLPEALNAKIELLAACESSGNPTALNPKDRDGTPSHGKYQFKIDTWKRYNRKYNLFPWRGWSEEQWYATMYDGYYQDLIVRAMFQDPAVNLHTEFPDCSRKHKFPARYYAWAP